MGGRRQCRSDSPLLGQRQSYRLIVVAVRDQTSGTTSLHGRLACLFSQVPRRRVLLVLRHAVDSKQHGRSARRLEDSSEDHPAGKYVPNSRPLARLCAAVLSANVLTFRLLGCGCRPRSPYTKLPAYVTGL